MKQLHKKDSPNCIAKITAALVFIENQTQDYFMAKVAYYENGIRLFAESSNVIRLCEADAIEDGVRMAQENGF